MPRDFKLTDRVPGPLRRVFSMKFWLQAGACAVVAWSLLHGGITLRSAEPEGVAPIGRDEPAAGASMTGPATGRPTAPSPTSTGLAASAARAAAATPSLAAAPSLESAQIALSSIDVVVTRNDTLDRIFRRLKLNLADLASLRSLPGIRTSLDSLRPGEALHLLHRDGQLFGLERRLNESQTLRVSREGDALKANVLQNALDLRSRTVRGVIDSSLFE